MTTKARGTLAAGLLITLAAWSAGCAQGGGTNRGDDAGSPIGTPMDGGRLDAAPPRGDGGDETDGGPENDAGATSDDAGTTRHDAGAAPHDAGPAPIDAGPLRDSGLVTCNPLTAGGCPTGDACRIVNIAGGYTTTCDAAGTFGLNTPCEAHRECPAGSECAHVDWDPVARFCYQYCTDNGHCTAGTERHCEPIPGARIGGTQYGICRSDD